MDQLKSSGGLMGATSVAPKQGEVDRELSTLSSRVEELHAVLAQLSNKLSPISTESVDRVEVAPGVPSVGTNTMVGTSIRDSRSGIESAIVKVRNITGRIEL